VRGGRSRAPHPEARALARKVLLGEVQHRQGNRAVNKRVDSERGEEIEAAPHRKKVRKATSGREAVRKAENERLTGKAAKK
jgi:hypothetical protein